MKNIVHIDLNAFFAQCEENINPLYKNVPIGIGEDVKRSVLSTCNYEARKYGVSSAMPIYLAKKKCPSLILVEPHFSLYQEVSKKFMSFLKERYPIMEIASIDETYIDMTDYFTQENAYSYLRNLQIDIYNSLHLKCSIGCSYNKFLAKMASDYKKPFGLTIVYNSDYKNLFWKLDISKMWGIGKKTYPKLKEIGINTIGDLANSNNKEVQDILGSSYNTFYQWANGKGNDILDTSSFNPKSTSAMETLIESSSDPIYLKDIIKRLAKRVYKELLYYKKKTNTVIITLRDNTFKTTSKRKKIELTDDFETIYVNLIDVFDSFYQNQDIRLIGVGLETVSSTFENISLFNTPTNNETKDNKQLIKELNSSLKSDIKLTTLSSLKGKKDENK